MIRYLIALYCHSHLSSFNYSQHEHPTSLVIYSMCVWRLWRRLTNMLDAEPELNLLLQPFENKWVIIIFYCFMTLRRIIYMRKYDLFLIIFIFSTPTSLSFMSIYINIVHTVLVSPSEMPSEVINAYLVPLSGELP